MNYVIFTQSDRFFLPTAIEELLRYKRAKAVIVIGSSHSKPHKYSEFFNKLNLFGIKASIILGVRTLKKIIFKEKSIRSVCKYHRVSTYFFKSIANKEIETILKSLKADLLVSLSCPQKIPPNLLNLYHALSCKK